MRESEDPPFQDEAESDTEQDSGGGWLEGYPSTTIEAHPVTKSTAGTYVTIYDLDEIDEPAMVEIRMHYPPEDDVEDDSVWLHGEQHALQLASALNEAVATRHDLPEYLEPDESTESVPGGED